MLELLIFSGNGFLLALIVAGGIYVDATRREISSIRRGVLITVFGGCSFIGGFLVPYLYFRRIAYVYLYVLKPIPHLTSPYEMLFVRIGTGLLISVLLGVGYIGGVQYWTRNE